MLEVIDKVNQYKDTNINTDGQIFIFIFYSWLLSAAFSVDYLHVNGGLVDLKILGQSQHI